MSAEELAKGLGSKAAECLRSRSWPQPSRFIHPAHRRWFNRQQIANEGYSRTIKEWCYFLTPLGLQVQALLKDKADG